MKGWNPNSVRLEGRTWPPSDEREPHDFPEGAPLDSLVARGAVHLVGRRVKKDDAPAGTDAPRG